MKKTNLTRANLAVVDSLLEALGIQAPEGANLGAKKEMLKQHFGGTLSVNAAAIEKILKPATDTTPDTPTPSEVPPCAICGAPAELKRRSAFLCGPCAVARDIKRKGKSAFADLAQRTPEGARVNRSHLASAFTWPLAREISSFTGQKVGQVGREVYRYTTALIKEKFPHEKASA